RARNVTGFQTCALPIYGKFHLLIAYCLTGMLSSLFSLMFVIVGISLGASGAVYGLLGIIIVHLLVHGRINLKLIIQIALIFVLKIGRASCRECVWVSVR